MPINLQPDETSRRVRKLLFASRGINLMVTGLWMCVQAGLQSAQAADPALKPFTTLAMVFSIILTLLSLRWVHRTRATQECRTSGSTVDIVRGEIKLFSVITLGVIAVLALYLAVPQIGEAEWLAPIALSLCLLVAGVYFVHEAIRLKLPELGVLGLVFWTGFMLVLHATEAIPTEEQFQSGMAVMQLTVGVLMLALGASLHRRWRLWREQVLSA